MKSVLKYLFLGLVLIWMAFAPAQSMAQEAEHPKEEKFDAKSFIFGHTGDAYCYISRKSKASQCVCGCLSL